MDNILIIAVVVNFSKEKLDPSFVRLSQSPSWLDQSYCQAQPQSQLSWAELALLLISPAARPPHILRRHLHISCATTIQTSSEIAGNQLNLLCKICRSTPEHLKIILNILKMWKTTSREDDLRGIQPPGETTFK